jgi:hypothetical protein
MQITITKEGKHILRGLLAVINKKADRDPLRGIWRTGEGDTARLYATDGRRLVWTCAVRRFPGPRPNEETPLARAMLQLTPGVMYGAHFAASALSMLVEPMDGVTPFTVEHTIPGDADVTPKGTVNQATAPEAVPGLLALYTGDLFNADYCRALPPMRYEVLRNDRDPMGPVLLRHDDFSCLMMPMNQKACA